MSNNEPVVEEFPAKEIGLGLVESTSEPEYVQKEMQNNGPIDNAH